MSLFVIGDTHLSLSGEKPMDVFGSRWNGYVEKLRDGWCRRVQDGDTVLVAGDISWAMTPEEAKADFDFLEELPGTKVILKGNHDFWWQTMAKLEAFVQANEYQTIRFLHNNAYETEEFILCGSRGWYTEDKNVTVRGADSAKIVAREVQRIRMSLDAGKCLQKAARERGEEKELVAFLHFPPIYKDYLCEQIIEVLAQAGITRCFFGHIHGNYETSKVIRYAGIEFLLISADFLQFEPYLISPCVEKY